MRTLCPSLAAAQDFLRRLDPKGVFTFQTFDDDKHRKLSALARVLHGTLSQHASQITPIAAAGRRCFRDG